MDAEEDDNLMVNVFSEVARNLGNKWRSLGRQLSLKEPALQNLEQEHRSGYEEVSYQMLEAWRQKCAEHATIGVLLRCLEEIERCDIVREIKKMIYKRNNSNELELMKNFGYAVDDNIHDKIEAKLKTWYSGLEMETRPWIPNESFLVAEVYSELQLVTKKRNGEQIELENIFDNVEGEKPYRILIEGGAGLGKTTVARKLTADWTAGKEYIKKRFKLLFLMSLKRFDFDSIDQALQYMGKLTNVGDKTLLEKITQNEEDVLLILDGFDELPITKRKCITPLLKSETYTKMTVILTCRTDEFSSNCSCQDSITDSRDQIFTERFDFCSKKILITGLKPDQQLALMQKLLTEDEFTENEKEITHLLEDLKELLVCPMFLFMLADLNKKSPVNIETKTQLYISFFSLMISRVTSSKDPPDLLQALKKCTPVKFNDDACELDVIVRAFTGFGRLALKKTEDRNWKFSTEEISSIESGASDGLFTKLGILTQTPDKSYEATHHSLVEFLIAGHLFASFGLLDQNSEESWQETIIFVKRYYSMVLPFLAGLLQSDSYKLFKLLSPLAYEYSACISYLVPILLEVPGTISEQIKTSLTGFLPVMWPISCCGTESKFASADIHKELIKHGIQEGKIKVLSWKLNGKVAICDHTEVETLHIVVNGPFLENEVTVPDFKCNDLKIILFDFDMTKNRWEAFINCICKIKAKTVSLHIMNFAEEWLPALYDEMLEKNLTWLKFQWITCSLREKKERSMQILTDIIKKGRTRGLELVFDHTRLIASQSVNSSARSLRASGKASRQIKNILTEIRKSKFTESVHLRDQERINGAHSEERNWLEVNLGCLSGKKWTWLRFWSVILHSGTKDEIAIIGTQLDFVDVQYDAEFIDRLHLHGLKCLSIDTAFLSEFSLKFKLCSLEKLDVLDVVLHGNCDWDTVLSNLRQHFTRISVLALTMPFTELDTPFLTKDFVLLLQEFTTLTALQFYGINRSTSLVCSILTELQTAIKEDRPLRVSEISLHSKSYQEYQNANTKNISQFKEILMGGNVLLKDLSLKCLKIVCPSYSLPDIVDHAHTFVSLQNIFPYMEGFRITHDITGIKTEDPLNYKHDFSLFTGYHRFSVEFSGPQA